MVVGIFHFDDPEFWMVLLFDIFLLVMRDADLWEDFAIFVRKYSGRVGACLLVLGKIYTA